MEILLWTRLRNARCTYWARALHARAGDKCLKLVLECHAGGCWVLRRGRCAEVMMWPLRDRGSAKIRGSFQNIWRCLIESAYLDKLAL